MAFLRNPATLLAINLATLFGIAGSTYNLRSHMIELSEDHEARMVCYISFIQTSISTVQQSLASNPWKRRMKVPYVDTVRDGRRQSSPSRSIRS